MNLNFSRKSNKKSLLIYPVFKKERVKNAAINQILQRLKRAGEFEAKDGQLFFLFEKGKSLPGKIILLGLGDAKKLTVAGVMSAFGGAVKSAAHHEAKSVSVVMPSQLQEYAKVIAEAVVFASYQPSRLYKTGNALKKLQKQSVENVEFVGMEKNEEAMKAARLGFSTAQLVNEVRDWVNAPPNFANAKFFDQKAKEIAKASGAKLTILRKKELTKLNMGALLGVNRGSPDEARLTILDYTPKGADPKEPPIVLVGKGILFDSGGYNLKPSGHMEDMQLDKAGAAAVIAVIKLLPQLEINKRIIAVAPFTENLIGRDAQKPSEIVKTYSGKTIEVTNTDAEGRLVLGDAIAYAVDQFKPKYLIDLATLTGACMIALGHRYAGIMGNDKDLIDQLRKAGDEVDEALWPLPLDKEHTEKTKGYYADLCNSDHGSARYAGASKGAAFLQEFVGKTKWAHLDIAGPAFTEDPKKYEHKGATGFGVRVVARFLESL
ncbi:MAG: leucyl aminopeptidase [Patescibacteria group bacterium]